MGKNNRLAPSAYAHSLFFVPSASFAASAFLCVALSSLLVIGYIFGALRPSRAPVQYALGRCLRRVWRKSAVC